MIFLYSRTSVAIIPLLVFIVEGENLILENPWVELVIRVVGPLSISKGGCFFSYDGLCHFFKSPSSYSKNNSLNLYLIELNILDAPSMSHIPRLKTVFTIHFLYKLPCITTLENMFWFFTEIARIVQYFFRRISRSS